MAQITPEVIKSKLFSLQNVAHSLHLDTRNFEEHKALHKIYQGVHDVKDNILEKLMGYQNGKRIGKAKLDELPIYSKEAVNQLIKDGLDFSHEMYEWAEEKEYCDIENMAQDLSGLFAHVAYMLTLT